MEQTPVLSINFARCSVMLAGRPESSRSTHEHTSYVFAFSVEQCTCSYPAGVFYVELSYLKGPELVINKV